MAYQDALLDQLDPTRRNTMAVPGLPGGTAQGRGVETQGGPASDPRWTNGTWGSPAGGGRQAPGGIVTTDPTMRPPLEGPGMPSSMQPTMEVPGPGSPLPVGPMDQIAGSTKGGPGQSYQDILGKYQYGAKGLGEAEGELNAAGYKLQKHSDGRVRGRIFDPSGRGIDVTDTDEGGDWWGAQTGDKWGSHDAGYGSPETTTPQGMDLMSLMGQSKTSDPMAGYQDGAKGAISQGVEQYSKPSEYLQALLAQLGGQQ
jgi:hypothetical protein